MTVTHEVSNNHRINRALGNYHEISEEELRVPSSMEFVVRISIHSVGIKEVLRQLGNIHLDVAPTGASSPAEDYLLVIQGIDHGRRVSREEELQACSFLILQKLHLGLRMKILFRFLKTEDISTIFKLGQV